MKSQQFRNTKTGEIVTQVPLSQIEDYEEYKESTVTITVTRCRPEWELHDLDAAVAGSYKIQVNPDLTSEQREESALDKFHATIPIKVLDDFYIDAKVTT